MPSGFVRFLRSLSQKHVGPARDRLLHNRFRLALERLEDRVVPALTAHSLTAPPALIQTLQHDAMVRTDSHVVQAKAVAARVSPFAGTYTGTFAGATINGNIAFTVASNGTISLTLPGRGSGSVSPTGAIQFTASAGGGVSDTFSATLVISSGNVTLGATTSFQAIKSRKVIDSGTWALTQAPTGLPLDTVTAVGPTSTSLLETPRFSWNAVSNGSLAGYALNVVDVTNAKKPVTVFSTDVVAPATSFVSPTAFLTLGHNYSWSVTAFDGTGDPSPVTTTTFRVISPLAGSYTGSDEETAHDIELPLMNFVIASNGSIKVQSPGNGKGTGSVDISGNAKFTAVSVGTVQTLHVGNVVYTNNISVSAGMAIETGGNAGNLKMTLVPRGNDTGTWNLGSAALGGTPLDTPTMTSISPLNPNNFQATASLTPTLGWAPVTGADYYVLAVDNLTTKQNHVVLATAIPSGTTTFTVPSPLVASDRYQWEVQAVTYGGNASTFSEPVTFFADIPTPAIDHVFYIDMENHDFTQPASQTSPSQIMGDTTAAPFLNGLVSGDPTLISAISTQVSTQVSYATNYYNLGYNTATAVHPSEPNYVWQESGTFVPGNKTDRPPFAANNIVNAPNLSALLQNVGISWSSYQEDSELGPNNGTVPLKDFEPGSSPNYTNPYNHTHEFAFTPHHDGQLYFTATNSKAEASHYEPLTQLATDLGNGTVSQYNVITPDLFNDMHTALDTTATINNRNKFSGFSYNNNAWMTGTPAQELEQEKVAQGDNFLSQVVPMITSSALWAKGHSAIVIWFDETRGGSTTNNTLTEFIISPLANGMASSTIYTHSSDLKTMQEVFGVFAPNGGFLGGANAAGTNDLLDMLHS
jgi:hypothetical protein